MRGPLNRGALKTTHDLISALIRITLLITMIITILIMTMMMITYENNNYYNEAGPN